jgi:hypothetical protein
VEQRIGVDSPLPKCDIVSVSQDYEKPCGLVYVSASPEVGLKCTFHYAQPSDKAVVLLKYVMMVANLGVSYWHSSANKS